MKVLITNNHSILEIHTAKGTKLISLSKIVFIKAFNKGSIIILEDTESIETRYLLSTYSKYLPAPYFFRCHNSYLVNCIYVDCFSCFEVILKNNLRIPLSRNKNQSFRKNLIDLHNIT